MLERVKTKKAAEVGSFYDEIYAKGGYFSEDDFNREALARLGIEKDEKKKLLDIACGQGTLLAMSEKYVKTYGIDISREAIKRAKSIAKKSNLKVCAAEKLPFPDNFFDYVTCMGSMEHFINIDGSLREIKRTLKKGGKVIIHVPNSKYLVHRILGIDTQGQINERFATEGEWKQIIEKHLAVIKTYKYNTRWYLKWIPKRYCCHFTFLCTKN